MSLLEARRPTRTVRAPASAPPSRARRGALAACAVLALVFGGLGLASALTARDSGDDTGAVRSAAWQRAVGSPERRLAAAVSFYLRDQSAWRAGTLPTSAFVDSIDGHRRDMAAAEASFIAARVPAALAGARARAVDAAGLYGESARVQQVALRNTGAVSDTLAAIATRLQALADRTYDRARLLVDPGVFTARDDGIEVRRAAPLTTAELASRVASEVATLNVLQQNAARLAQISARMAPEHTGEEHQ